MFSKQFSERLKSTDKPVATVDPQIQINANKYDRIMRSLSVKRDNKKEKVNIEIVQNFTDTKLYIPPKPKAASPVNEKDGEKAPKKSPRTPNEIEYFEVNINELMNEIIDALKDNCSNWFNESSVLRHLIPQALNYIDYNIKRNNNIYI